MFIKVFKLCLKWNIAFVRQNSVINLFRENKNMHTYCTRQADQFHVPGARSAQLYAKIMLQSSIQMELL